MRRSPAALLSLAIGITLVATTVTPAHAEGSFEIVDPCGSLSDSIEVTGDFEVTYSTVDGLTTWTVTDASEIEGERVVVDSAAFANELCTFEAAPLPVLSGVARVGNTLTVAVNASTPLADATNVQWLRAGVAVEGETGPTYELTASDLGFRITAQVTRSKADYVESTTTSVATAVVAKGILVGAVPVISGSQHVGQVLSADARTWTPAPDQFAYRWYRDGSAIRGATSQRYKLLSSDAGRVITVRVYGSKTGYTTVSKTSAGKRIAKLLTSARPTISGTAKYRSVLTASAGSWGPGTVSLSYRWSRGGEGISGATGRSYRLTKADAGKNITVTVTGKKTGYTTVVRTSVAKRIASAPSNPGDSKNCSDFSTHAAAQNWFNTYYPWYGDIANLDGDNDRSACETLP